MLWHLGTGWVGRGGGGEVVSISNFENFLFHFEQKIGAKTFSITTLSIMTFSIMALFATLSIIYT